MKFEIYRYKMLIQCAFQLETCMTTVLQSCQDQYVLVMVTIGMLLLSKRKHKKSLMSHLPIY
jgi:hypothetical protein